MVSPPQKREGVQMLVEAHGQSERHACHLVGMPRRSLSIPLRQVLLGISVAGECGGLLSHELFWGGDPDGSGQG